MQRPYQMKAPRSVRSLEHALSQCQDGPCCGDEWRISFPDGFADWLNAMHKKEGDHVFKLNGYEHDIAYVMKPIWIWDNFVWNATVLGLRSQILFAMSVCGDAYGFRVDEGRLSKFLIRWDHETRITTYLCASFETFVKNVQEYKGE